MNLGAILHLTGRLEGAKVSYKEALRLNPRDELTIANLRKLESMQLRTQSMKWNYEIKAIKVFDSLSSLITWTFLVLYTL